MARLRHRPVGRPSARPGRPAAPKQWSSSAASGSHPPPSAARPRAGPHGGRATPGRRGRASASWASPSGRRRRWRGATRSPPRATARELARGSRVTAVPLLTPRVAVVVIAERLPESGLIALHEAQLPHPLRALPEVEVWHEEARGTAVLGRERHTVVSHRHPCLAAGHVGERQVGRVATVGHREHVRRRLHTARGGFRQERVHGDSLPDRVELGPLRDAMDVGRHGLVRQRLEFVPRPACRRCARTTDREVPRRERGTRRGTGREHGEVARLVLARREPAGGRRGLSAAAKSSGDEWLGHGFVLKTTAGNSISWSLSWWCPTGAAWASPRTPPTAMTSARKRPTSGPSAPPWAASGRSASGTVSAPWSPMPMPPALPTRPPPVVHERSWGRAKHLPGHPRAVLYAYFGFT